jgi:hypothetical protein
MFVRAHKLTLLALFLAVVFVGAQFHQCADLSSNSSATHVCPVCSMAASAVVTASPVISFVSTDTAFVARPSPRVVSSNLPYAASPRASPSL